VGKVAIWHSATALRDHDAMFWGHFRVNRTTATGRDMIENLPSSKHIVICSKIFWHFSARHSLLATKRDVIDAQIHCFLFIFNLLIAAI
jgi:hypothetical protein